MTWRLREIVRMLCGSVSSETGDDYVVDGDDDYMEDDGVDGGRSFVRGEVGRGVGEMWRERRDVGEVGEKYGGVGCMVIC